MALRLRSRAKTSLLITVFGASVVSEPDVVACVKEAEKPGLSDQAKEKSDLSVSESAVLEEERFRA